MRALAEWAAGPSWDTRRPAISGHHRQAMESHTWCPWEVRPYDGPPDLTRAQGKSC